MMINLFSTKIKSNIFNS